MRSSRLFVRLGLLVASLTCAFGSAARADLLYSSATLGTTGVPAAGYTLSDMQYIGARFTLATSATIDHVGGHMASFGGTSTAFAAIVKLTSSLDFPDSGALNTADVLATTTFSVTAPSSDISVPIGPLVVPAGIYGLVFGGGLFGSSATVGTMLNTNTEIDTPSYFFYNSTDSSWNPDGVHLLRFTVTGTVPEPAFGLLFLPLALLARRSGRAQNI